MKTLLATSLAVFAVSCGRAVDPIVSTQEQQPPEQIVQPPLITPAPVPGAQMSTGPWTQWPLVDWQTGDAEQHGLNAADLDRAEGIAEMEGSYCLLVIRHGVIVREHYWNGAVASDTHPSWSIAKSWTSAVVGVAISRGEIRGLDQSASDFIPEWRGTSRASITIGHLLTMTSGLEWSAFRDYVTMVTFTEDQTQFAVNTQLRDTPGAKWTYDNGGVQIFERVIRAATGKTLEQYAQEHLWGPMNMRASWGRDRAGNPTAYANVLATCRDQARLGYLYLHKGQWGDQQLIPRSWIDQSTTPSQGINRAYGLLWWVNADAPTQDAMMQSWPGRMVPYAPPDLFAARGFGNQFIDVIPSLDLIVVRFGPDPAGAQFDLGELMTDARFEKHDRIFQPILGAVRP